MANLLYWASDALGILGLITLIASRGQRMRTAAAFFVAGGVFVEAACLVTRDELVGIFSAPGTGYWAWIWWNSGGGDGTKRRLKAFRRRFKGVRRTAPALGASFAAPIPFPTGRIIGITMKGH
jgi:hypothetical protein